MLKHPSELVHPFRDQVIEILDKTGLFTNDQAAKSCIAALCRNSVPENFGPHTASVGHCEDLQNAFHDDLLRLFYDADVTHKDPLTMSAMDKIHFEEQQTKMCTANAIFMSTLAKMSQPLVK